MVRKNYVSWADLVTQLIFRVIELERGAIVCAMCLPFLSFTTIDFHSKNWDQKTPRIPRIDHWIVHDSWFLWRRWAPNPCITCIVVFCSYFFGVCGSRVVQMTGTGLYVSYLIFIHLIYHHCIMVWTKLISTMQLQGFWLFFVRWIYFWGEHSIMPWRESSRMVIPSIRVIHPSSWWPWFWRFNRPPPPCCFTSTGVKEL